MNYCVTNDIPDVRSCTIRGSHTVSCDTREYQWSGSMWETGEWVSTGRECRGCMPREASTGFVCWACWQDVEDAENAFYPLKGLLETYDRLLTTDSGGVRTSPSGSIPLPPTALALDEIMSYRRLHAGDTATWVGTLEGAADAVHFARAVKGALRSFPTDEAERKITRTRCSRCEQLALIWTPPRFASDHVRVKCMNCEFELDQTSFEIIADRPTTKPKEPA